MRIHFSARVRRLLLTTALATGLGGCNSGMVVTNINQPNIAASKDAATAVQYLITAMLAEERNNIRTWITTTGAYGREYWLENLQFGQTISGPLKTWNQPQSTGLWNQYYATLRNIQQIKKYIDTTKSPTISASQKASARGIADTFEALELLYAIGTRDTAGITVQVDSTPLAIYPFVTRDSAYKFISAILDSGQTAMASAGAIGFTLPDGFVSVANSPAGWNTFNRALKARVENYRGSLDCGTPCYAAALTALSQSFFTGAGTISNANKNVGVFHAYSTAAGDSINTLTFPTNGNYANTSIRDDGKIANVTADARYVAKVASTINGVAVPTLSEEGFVSNLALLVYGVNGTSAPVPLIRNEELSLIYAEASYFTGATGPALAELNALRANVGGVAPVAAPANTPSFIQLLLNERRLSLLYEGHRWVDSRRLLGNAGMQGISSPTTTGLQWFGLDPVSGAPVSEPAGYSVATSLPIPLQECLNRKNSGNAALVPASCNQ